MTKSLILSSFVLCFLALASSTHVDFEDCGKGKATSTIAFVDITPCDKQPCTLKRGTEETMEVQFTPHKAITAAKTIVHGKLPYLPVQLPFPVDNPDACKDQGIECPMAAGKTYTFKTVLPIKSMYPTTPVIVTWEMKDQDNNLVYCWQIAAQIEG
ncbi:Phosphatidylglycerol/phosphatidylinositol transfer protein [Desmophyllum pertusum]|uniref:Phosphatidylglycerol/phosphatidylinositol transfer protein n=1 Tax=Desmophyllum pertusum TaxID=174260 RepID=A0A9W9YSQ7_9CNID|nr:Phosphatidylglycerol/phosphatidylinositol transfer protein [Desmophyllum pertusum]